MAKIHTRTFRVRWSELDANGRFAPENYLRYLIETAYDWGDSLGLGSAAYEDMGIYWLIRETAVEILDTPTHNDVVDLTIWMVQWQKVRGTRNFEVKHSATGQVIARGSQKIVVMDRNSNRPTALGEDFIGMFRVEDPRSLDIQAHPYTPSAAPVHIGHKKVEWQDLDAQNHVNNAVYLSYARQAIAEMLAEQGEQDGLAPTPAFIQLQYSLPAVWGDRLDLAIHEGTSPSGGKSYLVKMARENSGELIADCVITY